MRSLIREDQTVDADFLSEQEFALASGVINQHLINVSGTLQQQITDHINNDSIHSTVSGGGLITSSQPQDGDILVYSSINNNYDPKKISKYIEAYTIATTMVLGG